MQFLRVKNLDRYQHYGNRNPPWIKLYRVILGDYALRQVSVPSRLAFIYCMVLASETDNRVPFDCPYLSDRMGFKVTEDIITPLIDCGVLLASGARRMLAIEEKCSSLPNLLLTSSQNPERSNGHTKPKGKRAILESDGPTEKHRELARALKVDIGPEWGKFKNYCLAHDKRYANYEAAFRNWIARADELKRVRR